MITSANVDDIHHYVQWVTEEITGVSKLCFSYPIPVGNAFYKAKDILVPFSALQDVLPRAIQLLLGNNKCFALADIPLCIVDTRQYLNPLPHPPDPDDVYFEPGGTRWLEKEESGQAVFPAVCSKCNQEARSLCSGIFQTYLNFYGSRELVPFQ